MDDAHKRLIEKFYQERKIQITVRQELQGLSGAFVALVDAKGATDGIFIVKVGLVPTDHDDEEILHRRAQTLGAFNDKIPELVDSIRSAHHYLLLERLAGGSRIDWQPLIDSVGLLRAAYVRLGEVLWTPTLTKFSADSVPGAKIIQSWLGYMLDSKRRGRIVENIRHHFGDKIVDSHQFMHSRRAIPNPLQFALGNTAVQGDLLTPLMAPLHGDCHGRNILVRANSNAGVSDIALIDFASFKDQAPFFFDHAYFELSTLLRRLRGLGSARWVRLVETLSMDQQGAGNLEPDERAWAEDILSGRTAALNPIYDKFPDRKDDLRLQFILAQVAVGLNFLNKRATEGSGTAEMTRESHQRAFVWSGIHLETTSRHFALRFLNMMSRFPSWVLNPAPLYTKWTKKTGPRCMDLTITD